MPDVGSDPDRRAAPGASGRWLHWLLLGGLLVAVAYFAVRGIWRGIEDSGDLAVGYSAARAWLSGADPYDVRALQDEVLRAGGSDAVAGRLTTLRNVYVPATLFLFVPLAPIPWSQASLLWVACNVGATLVIALGLVRFLEWRWLSMRAVSVLAFVFALSPVHLTIASGQTALVAVAFLVAGMLWERSRGWGATGLANGFASTAKIQIGLPFLVHLAWRRRWIAVAVAVAALGLANLLSIARMQVAGVPWFASWTGNLAQLSGPGGVNDPSVLNPDRYSLVNLQYLLHAFGIGYGWADAVTYASVGLAAALLAWLIRGRRIQSDLLAFSIVAVLGLLVTYHRYYDAVLLAFPIAWAVSAIGTAAGRVGVLVLLLCADFVFPVQTALYNLDERGLVPAWLSESWLWTYVLLTQHVWALMFLAFVLLAVAFANRRQLDAPQDRAFTRFREGSNTTHAVRSGRSAGAIDGHG